MCKDCNNCSDKEYFRVIMIMIICNNYSDCNDREFFRVIMIKIM